MGIDRQYFKENHFILTKFFGCIDDQILMQYVNEHNKETEGISNLKELVDLRKITSVRSLTTKSVTMAAGIEQHLPDCRLAILAPKNDLVIYGLANAYRMFAEDSRELVKVFENIQEALGWLSTSEQEAESLALLMVG